MKKMLTFYELHKKTCYIAAGFALSALFMIPFLLLGTGSVITYHDQLDGELLNYILGAKYLFTDIRVYPEIMNGIPAAGAVPPAPLFVPLYILFRPFTAFLLTQWVICFTAFFGMYLLLSKLTGQEFISFGIASIFMLLPFYPVYGLCIPGQPLLFYAILSLRQQEKVRRRALLYYACIALYAAASSPVLVGFACLLALLIFALRESIVSLRAKEKIPCSPWLSCFVLSAVYVACNLELAKQALFPGSTYVSHKTELALSPAELLSHFKEVFGTGVDYAKSYHTALFFLFAVCLSLFLARRVSRMKKQAVGANAVSAAGIFSDSETLFFQAFKTLLCIFLICLFSAFYRGSFVTGIRNASAGLLKTFNLERVCWLLPTAWCVLAAYLLAYLSSLSGDRGRKRILAQAAILAALGIWGITVLFHSALYPNLAKLRKGGNYYALDWENFFAEDIFSQIADAIGEPKESYRVVSVGIYPAAAAYSGFYCLDGYSNNYPLAYKRSFRRIIEGELAKNEYVRTLFDEWGNRCYVTTAEQANYYTFEKKWNSVIYDLDLDTDALKELNCKYIFSAAYLMNAQEKGLALLREAPFETETSWYHIYVYKVF